MPYDFDTPIDRRGSGCYKWDSTAPDVLPLWVADMDFRVAPAITAAIQRRAEHGVFGYVSVQEEYYEAVIRWFRRRHGWEIERDTLLYTLGVVPAISAILRATTLPGDKVLVQEPVYNAFFSSIRNMGLVCVSNNLIDDGGYYRIDWEDLETKAADPQVRVMLLCNPHNPVGRVWTPEELRRIGDICLRNHVFVIADEIHGEFVFSGYRYTPYGSLSPDFLQNSAICLSPSKAFNTAGLQMANIVAADPYVRARIDKAINIHEVCDVNPFGPVALMAAYNESEAWLDELLVYIEDNYRQLCDFFARELPAFRVTRMEGTYLAWVNISPLNKSSDRAAQELADRGKLRLNAGSIYGKAGERYLRINMACPRSILTEALHRLHAVWKSF